MFTEMFKVAPPNLETSGTESRTHKLITWGHDIEVPLVPTRFWTDARIQSICNESNKEKEHVESESKNLEIEEDNSEFKLSVIFATKCGSELFSATNKTKIGLLVSISAWTLLPLPPLPSL